MQLILELERDEIEALLEDVTFDSGLDYHAGGHPASTRLLSKIEKAIQTAYGGITLEQFFAENAANARDCICGHSESEHDDSICQSCETLDDGHLHTFTPETQG
jgi:hypothetical protein